jgi:integrase
MKFDAPRAAQNGGAGGVSAPRAQETVPPFPFSTLVFSPLEAERMARREFQNPSVLERESAAGKEFYIRYRIRVLTVVDGKPVAKRKEKWVSLGLCAKMTARKAERERDKIMREVNGQVYTIQSHIPLKDFIEVFKREHYRGLKENTKDFYDARLAGWVVPMLGDKKLYQIGAMEISEMLGAMEEAGVARSTRLATRALMASMLDRARRWGYLKERSYAAHDAEVGRSNKGGRTLWTPTIEEARAVIEQADEEIGIILELIIWTGMRISEVLGLRCGSLDVDQAVLYVREQSSRKGMEDPKSVAGQRPLPLGYLADQLRPRIMSAGNPEAFIFARPDGTPWNDNLLYHRIRSAMDDAGQHHEGNAWHSFRRLHSTIMKKRMSLFDLKTQMGHADIKTTQLYVGTEVGDRAEALPEAQNKVLPFRKKAST